jgi:hypothetical protein
MRFHTRGLAPVLLAVLGFGCSSKSSPHADASPVSEAGAIDGPRSDARDGVRIDLAVTEAGAVRDTKNTPIDAADRDTKDSRPLGVDGPPSEVVRRDTSADSKRDAAGDAIDEPDLPIEPPAVSGTCASPIEIPYTAHIELTADTTAAEHVLDFPCAANGADIVFKVRADGPELVYADTFGTTWNTALLFSDSCEVAAPPEGDGMAACNDDACGTGQSQAFATLQYGFHYLIVSGVKGASGPLRLHYERAPLGNGAAFNLPAGTATLTGTTGGSDSTRTCDMAGPKNSYWWTTCPTDVGGPFHATTCNGSTWDAALILQVPRLNDSPLCADDDPLCGVQATLDGTIPPGAGLAVLTVTGNLMRSFGDYVVTYTRP